jgi:hypothetical protein
VNISGRCTSCRIPFLFNLLHLAHTASPLPSFSLLESMQTARIRAGAEITQEHVYEEEAASERPYGVGRSRRGQSA